MLFSGAQASGGGGGSTLVQTMTLLNTAGSATAADTHTPMLMVKCKKGDYPSGTYPILKTSGGTTVPFTYMDYLKSTWSDGSLKLLPVLPRFTDAISGSGTASLKVYNGGTTQSASAITLAMLYAENFTIDGTTGIDNISPAGSDWSAQLQAANVLETIVYGSGPAGIVWRLLIDFNRGGSPHGQLVAYVYIQGMQNAAGGLAGWRLLPEVTQPWYNYDTPAKAYRSFTSLVLKANGSLVCDPMSVYSAKQFVVPGASFTASITGSVMTVTAVASGTIGQHDNIGGAGVTAGTKIDTFGTGAGGTGTYNLTASQTVGSRSLTSANTTVNSTAHGYTNGVAGRLTTTGTLPAGLSLNTTYWIDAFDGTFALPNTWLFQDGSCWEANVINPTDVGTGVHTFTPIPYVNQFCLYPIATTQGRYVYCQGAGSVAVDATMLVKADTTYDHSTRVLPPWNISTAPNSYGSFTWGPYQRGAVGMNLNAGGDGPGGDRGPMPDYMAAHFARQALVDETVVRIAGLTAGFWPYRFMDHATKQNVNLSNGLPYTGMPSSVVATVQWRAGGGSGFTNPAGGLGQSTIAFPGINTAHLPDLATYPYLITGEPQYYDRMKDGANMTILCQSPTDQRSFTVPGGSTYSPVMPAGDKTGREGSWGMRYIVLCAGCSADADPFTPYVKALSALQFSYEVAFFNSQNSWAKSVGFWYPQNNNAKKAGWQDCYENSVRCMGAGICEDANAMTMVDKAALWATSVRTQFGGSFMLTTYHENSGLTIDSGGGTLISAWNQWGASPQDVFGLSWDSSTNEIIWTTPNFTPHNDMYVLFAGTGTAPGGLSTMVYYRTVQTSGNRQKLSLTSGGSPVTITDTRSASIEDTRVNLITPPALGSIGYTGLGPTQHSGWISWALALGCSVSGLATVANDLDANTTMVDWTQGIKWRMNRTF